MHFEDFVHYLTYERRFSAHTITAYKADLDQFRSYIKTEFEVRDPAEVNKQVVRSWLASLAEREISPRSINRKITTLKTYFKFLMKHEIVQANPMQKIIAPKTSKRLPIFVEKSEINQLLDSVEFENDFTGTRDKLIIHLFYQSGMRLSELVNLELNDIDFYQSTIRVLGKRNKERLIPFGVELKNLINIYLDFRKPLEITTQRLFLTDKGKDVYQKLVYRVVNNYLSKVTMLEKKSPHIIRHTFATHLLNNGADLNAIKELLGHANLAATQVYTHNSFEKLKTIYKQAHPRA